MSDTARWILIAVVVLAVAAAAIFLVPTWDTEERAPVSIDTLDAWVAFTTRPGFELLDKKAFEDYFIAVYRTPADQVAFCYRWRGPGDAPGTSLAVRDPDGQDVQDPEGSKDTAILNPPGPLLVGAVVDGMVFPIRGEHEGPLMLIFKDNADEPGAIPGREVYLRTVAWERR